MCYLVHGPDLPRQLSQSVATSISISGHHLLDLRNCLHVVRPYVSDHDLLYQLHGTADRGILDGIRIVYRGAFRHLSFELEDGGVQGDDRLLDVSARSWWDHMEL